MTLSPETILRVRALLAKQCGYRQIERLTGGAASKSTIANIDRAAKNYAEPPAAIGAGEKPPPVYTKCSECHYRVELPCRICEARKWRHWRHLQKLKRQRRKRTA